MLDRQGSLRPAGPHGETVYLNQFFSVSNREGGSKHVFVGSSRIATKLVKGQENVTTPGHSDPPGNAWGHTGNNGGGSGGGSPGNGAIIYEPDVFYYHPDHLGSTSFVTDLEGKVYQHLEYFPFGETWVEEVSDRWRVPYLFTAKELDRETGLYYFGARYYDPRTSVWQSPDPILGKYLDGMKSGVGVYTSLNINLYIYAHNNPLMFTDIEGRDVIVYFSGFHGFWEKPYRHLKGNELTTGRMAREIRGYAGANKIEDVNVLTYATGKDMTRNVSDAYQFIIQNLDKDNEKIAIYGYSLGGEAAVRLTDELNSAGIKVDLLVTGDSYVPESYLKHGQKGNKNIATSIVPNNVKKALNFYQQQTKNQHGKPFTITPESETNLSNKLIESSHADVDEKTRTEVQTAIKNLLKE